METNYTIEDVKRFIKDKITNVYSYPSTDITDDMSLSSVGMDSLDLVELTIDLETRYGIDFEDESIYQDNRILESTFKEFTDEVYNIIIKQHGKH